MKKLQKFLEDLVGKDGFQSLSKAVKSEDSMQNFVAPRVLVAWLAKSVSEMSPGESRTVSLPGTEAKFVTFTKGTGESFRAEVVSHGKAVLSTKADDASESAELLKFIMDENSITPSLPVDSNTRKVMAAIGKLADKLVKKEEKQQKEMEEDHKVHDSKKPEEKYEEEIKDAAKDKTLEKPVPSIAEYERGKSQVRTQPFQKDGLKEQITSGLNASSVADAAAKLNAMRPHAPKGVPGSQGAHLKSAMEKLGRMKAAETGRQLTAPGPQKTKLVGAKTPMAKQEPLMKKPSTARRLAGEEKSFSDRAAHHEAKHNAKPLSYKVRRAVRNGVESLSEAATGFGTGFHNPYVNDDKSEAESYRRLAANRRAAGKIQKEEMGKADAVRAWSTKSTNPGRKSGEGRYHEASLQGNMVRRGQFEQAKGAAKASIMQERAIPKPKLGKAGELPSGAGIPKQPKQAKPPVMPSTKPASAAAQQAQQSGKGKQMVQAKPKMAIKSESVATNLKKFSVTEAEANTPCEHCKKPQFKNGQFDPCLCFRVEKSGKEPFVKLVKTEAGNKLEFRKNADPESVHAFLLALKLGLIAEKLNRR